MDNDPSFQGTSYPLRQMNQTDEISLVDLALVFMRHKWVFLATVVICLLAGGAFDLFKLVTYTYTTQIEIGIQFVEGEPQPLESPSSALAKIQASYIPLALQAYHLAQGPDASAIEVTASIPPDSTVVRIESQGTLEKATVFQVIHAAIAERLLQDHQTITNVIRKDLENEVIVKQNDLLSIQDQIKVLTTERTRLEKTEVLIKQQAEKSQRLIDVAEQNRTRSVNEATDESRAMTLLMINNEIQQNRNQLLNLQERLNVGIPNERDRLAKAIEDNRRQQSEIKNQMEALKLRISNLRQTRVVATATRSVKPAGLGLIAIIALSFVIGGVLGIALVLLLELVAAARRRQAELPAAERPFRY